MALLVGELKAVLDLETSKYDQGLDRSHAKFSKFVKGAAIASAAVAVAAGAGLLKLAKGAAEDEKAQKVLATTLKNTARATDAQVTAIEEYITKTGAATGVTDDEMRPALANLVRATHDVGKAQSLMGLAMDVSAGTGKDLGAVSMALAKAHNGNVGALGKLGIATKDASGKTLSFEQIQKNLAKTFKGQTAAAAETTAGKFERLKLIASEAGESIGAKVLPVLLALGNFLLNTVVPAVVTFGRRTEVRLLPVLRSIGSFIGEQIVPRLKTFAGFLIGVVVPAVVAVAVKIGAALVPILTDMGTKITTYVIPALQTVGVFLVEKVVPALGKMADFVKRNSDFFIPFVEIIVGIVVALKAWAIVQGILNAVLAANPIGLVVIGLAALAAGAIWAYKHIAWFHKGVDAVFHGIETVIHKVIPAVVNFFAENWKRLPLLLLGPIGLVLFIFKGLPGKILQALGNLGRLLVRAGKDLVGGLKDGVDSIARTVGRWMYDHIISPAVRPFSKAGTWLKSAGRNVIAGFKNGLVEIWTDVVKWISGIATWIKDHKGPVSLDGRLLIPAGKAIMSGFLRGLKSGAGQAWSFVSKIGGKTKEAVATAAGWIKGLGWPNIGSTSLGTVGKGVERWRGVALEALRLTHSPASWINSLLRRMNQESGGNPFAINLTDINARRGDPSRGLMQTIMATFNAYKRAGVPSSSIYSPLENIIASINYANARYGAAPRGWDRAGGYRLGTPYVPYDGMAYLHRGERVITADQNKGKGNPMTVALSKEDRAMQGALLMGIRELDQALRQLGARPIHLDGRRVDEAMSRTALGRGY